MSQNDVQPTDVWELRAVLRTDLTSAMKAHDQEAVAALRSALAVIDNAEAVAPADNSVHASSEHVAGASVGVGSSEASRRKLTADDVQALLRAEIEERLEAARNYEAHGQSDLAGRLRREADVLGKYVRSRSAGSNG
ncbi:MAG: GatB/YqeY domain-containing protein [Ancrocorticia sp.]|uniref:GatB/YqeY domain-containing protein n=1 Tax=Ancrocorticia sp. TaxID=2593684 RepID=UPI003F8F583C